jgi:hypothetical protein
VYRVIRIQARNRVGMLALAVTALMLGGVLLAFGLLLLLGLAAVGAAIGAGVVLYYKLTGRVPRALERRWRAADLDPALEVFPAGASPSGQPGASRPKEPLQLPRE